MYICSTITIFLYEAKERASVDDMTSKVIDIFQKGPQNYGTRKIKVEFKKRGHIVSRQRIGRIMQEQGLDLHCSSI
jgi:putative transposase